MEYIPTEKDVADIEDWHFGIRKQIDEVIKKLQEGTLEGGESLCKPGSGKGYGLDKTQCDHPEQNKCDHK